MYKIKKYLHVLDIQIVNNKIYCGILDKFVILWFVYKAIFTTSAIAGV